MFQDIIQEEKSINDLTIIYHDYILIKRKLLLIIILCHVASKTPKLIKANVFSKR